MIYVVANIFGHKMSTSFAHDEEGNAGFEDALATENEVIALQIAKLRLRSDGNSSDDNIVIPPEFDFAKLEKSWK